MKEKIPDISKDVGQEKQITFDEARKNAELKQKYLDIVKQSCPESVQNLIYDPDWKNRNEYMDKLTDEKHLDREEAEKAKTVMGDAYFLVIFSPSLCGAGRKHPIFISDSGFSKMRTEAHFLNSIQDHEAIHTDDLMYGISLPNDILVNYNNIDQLSNKTVINIREVRAYRNQLRKIKERGINDPSFVEWLKWNLQACEGALASITGKTELEKRVLDSF